MKRSLSIIVLVLWLASAARGDEAPAARAYLDAVQGVLGTIEGDLSHIAEAADRGAARLLGGGELGVRGGAGLAWELADRPGGLAMYHGGRGGKANDVILYAIGVIHSASDAREQIAMEIADAAALREAGCLVIGMASHEQLRDAALFDEATAACDVLLDNHAPYIDGQPPMNTIANAAVAWTWTSELFAACARRGRPPVMRKSFETDYRRVRYARYRHLRFHYVSEVEPIEPGVLGRAYLRGLREVLTDVGTASWPALADAAHRAGDTIDTGGRVFVRVGGRYLAHHHGNQLAHDPNHFIGLDHDGSHPALPSPGGNDLVLAFGYLDPPGADYWGEPEMLRDAGRGVAWVVSGCYTKPRDLQPGEILIDQHWPLDDALVRVEGYDIPIAPASGIVSETIYWSIAAQVDADLKSK